MSFLQASPTVPREGNSLPSNFLHAPVQLLSDQIQRDRNFHGVSISDYARVLKTWGRPKYLQNVELGNVSTFDEGLTSK